MNAATYSSLDTVFATVCFSWTISWRFLLHYPAAVQMTRVLFSRHLVVKVDYLLQFEENLFLLKTMAHSSLPLFPAASTSTPSSAHFKESDFV